MASSFFRGKRRYTPVVANTRFILAGMPRSGSEWVRTALGSHPEVICNSEILGGWIPEYKDRTPVDILTSYWNWVRGTDEAKAIGFKLFYLHCRRDREKHIWDWIKNDSGIRVVLLLRRNLLKSVTSLHLAKTTNLWHVKEPVAETQTVKITNILDELRAVEDGIAFLRDVFRDHRLIEIHYEDVVAGPSGLRHVFEFLDVTRMDVVGKFARQERRPLSEVISNYDEVAASLRGTRYEKFLEA